MRNEDMRDEAAQQAAALSFQGLSFLDYLEDIWQEVNAEEKPYDRLHEDYYTGFAEMVLRVANCWVDEIRARAANQVGLSDDARQVARMKIDLTRPATG